MNDINVWWSDLNAMNAIKCLCVWWISKLTKRSILRLPIPVHIARRYTANTVPYVSCLFRRFFEWFLTLSDHGHVDHAHVWCAFPLYLQYVYIPLLLLSHSVTSFPSNWFWITLPSNDWNLSIFAFRNSLESPISYSWVSIEYSHHNLNDMDCALCAVACRILIHHLISLSLTLSLS